MQMLSPKDRRSFSIGLKLVPEKIWIKTKPRTKSRYARDKTCLKTGISNHIAALTTVCRINREKNVIIQFLFMALIFNVCMNSPLVYETGREL
jgi:hypothetical protein